jgi:zinc transporter 1
VNAVFLVALCFSITMESLKRFYEPEEIHDPELILYVGVMGLVVNLLGLCLFAEHGSSHGHSHGGGKIYKIIYFWLFCS